MILSIGGSVLIAEDRSFRDDVLKSYVELIETNAGKIEAVVVGGGSLAREYIRVGQSTGLSDDSLDGLGIDVTRVNATLVSNSLNSESTVIKDVSIIEQQDNISGIPVLGGTETGQTTDAVAAQVAELFESEHVLFCSNIDGVYDTRGGVGIESAKKFEEISTSELRQIISTQEKSPGRNIPVDKNALDLLDKSGTTAVLFDGSNVENTSVALDGTGVGTRIHPN